MIARVDRAHGKPEFRAARKAARRCLVRVDGSYERKGQRPTTQLLLTWRERGTLFAFSSLGQRWAVWTIAGRRVHTPRPRLAGVANPPSREHEHLQARDRPPRLRRELQRHGAGPADLRRPRWLRPMFRV